MSTAKKKSPRRRFQFRLPNGTRSGLSLGRTSARVLDEVKRHVEHIIAARMAGLSMPVETAAWIARLDHTLVQKLIDAGVLDSSHAARPNPQLGDFIADYLRDRTDLKPSTRAQLKLTETYLVEKFGGNRVLSTITPGDADAFRRWLAAEEGKDLAENTVRRLCGRAKQLFKAAVRLRLLDESPFSDMRGCLVTANRSRDFFVTRKIATDVLAACPDHEWRLIFALCRFGGLRCPSEVLALRWEYVDWQAGRIRIPCIKTQHHEGRDWREIPIFPELRPYLEDAFGAANDKRSWVITRYRQPNANLRTQLLRIIDRAGLQPWDKVFQNLRASCETDLMKRHELHVVCAWMGHAPKVALSHYLQVTSADYEAAVRPPASPLPASDATAAPCPAATPASKKWCQSGAANHREAQQEPAKANRRQRRKPRCAAENESSRTGATNREKEPVPRLGLEPRTL